MKYKVRYVIFTLVLTSLLLQSNLIVNFANVNATIPGYLHEDFEDIIKIDEHHINMSIANYFYFQGDSGARMWIEGLDEKNIQAHSGQRCIGMELFDIEGSRRNEFNLLHMYDSVGNEFTTSAWYYLPSDWSLTAGNGLNWYSIFAIQTGGPAWAPYLELCVEDMTSRGGSETYKLFIINRDENQVPHYSPAYENFPLPLGQWFEIKSEFSQPNQTFKIWVADILVANMSLSLDRTPIFDTNAIITISKIYHDPNDSIPNRLWIDDITIKSLDVSSSPNPTTYPVTVNTPGLESARDIVHYVEDGVSKTGSISSRIWTGNCDSGSVLSIDEMISISDDKYYYTVDTTSWRISESQAYTVTYQTHSEPNNMQEVTVQLIDSNGNGIIGAIVEYYDSGWKDFGITNSNGEVKKELLPSNYRFQMSYGGESISKRQDIISNPIVTFKTVKVTVKLLNGNNDDLTGGLVKYYAEGWKTIGYTRSDGTVTKELLPQNYKFQISYEGATLKKRQNIESDPIVTFKIR